LSIINESSSDSLVIIDELGRGTSTYDGLAIAYSVLKYIAEELGCLTFFVTHYHSLLEEFRLYDNVMAFHMASKIEEGQLKLMYKFLPGTVGKSFGINVARIAGLPSKVIARAEEKSSMMGDEKQKIEKNFELAKNFNKIIENLLEMDEVEEAFETLDNVAQEYDSEDLEF